MPTLDEARHAILARVRPADAVETVPVARARGRFAAATLAAAVDNPAFDNSSMDGYALRAADLAAHDGVLPVEGEASCCSAPQQLRAGTTMRIFTGAPLPAGADTVVILAGGLRRRGGCGPPARPPARPRRPCAPLPPMGRR